MTETDDLTCHGVTRAGTRCQRRVYLNYVDADGNLYCKNHADAAGAERVGSLNAIEQQKADPNRPHPREPCAGRRRDGSPCPSLSLWYVDADGHKHPVCDWHHKLGVLDPPPRQPNEGKHGGRKHGTTADGKKVGKRGNLHPIPAKTPFDVEVIQPDVLDEPQEAVAVGVSPREVRSTLQSDIALNYDAVQKAILDALNSQSKIWITCPGCRKRSQVEVSATAERLKAAQMALDVFGKPPTAPVEVAAEGTLTDDDLARMSTEQLMQIVIRARPNPTRPIEGRSIFGDLPDEVRDVLDTVAAFDEGHDVEERRLQRAAHALVYWEEMVKLLSPVVGLSFAPKEEVPR